MKLWFAIPGDLNLPTGGYGYDRRLIEGLRGLGWEVEHVPLPGCFPFPDEDSLRQTDAALAAVPDSSLVLIDGLAFGAMPALTTHHANRLHQIALVHHPLCDETGLSDALQVSLHASEKTALASARSVICTSRATASRLEEGFHQSPDKCVVAEPGTDRASRRATTCDRPGILAVGSLVIRKGHDVLIRALATIADRPWAARIVGADDRDPDTTEALHTLIRQLGLEARITLAGAVENVRPELETAQIFALASHHEGYGMAFAEALAHGLPIIACAAGAVPDLVPATAGALVPPSDPHAFGKALASVIDNRLAWQQAADASWHAGQALPGWDDTARIVAAHLKETAHGI